MSIGAKRIVSAWILLAVFLSAMVVSLIHRHELSSESFVCADCANHVHHQGHLLDGSSQMDRCLVCQFLCTTYLGAATVVVAFSLFFRGRRVLLFAEMLCGKAVVGRASRAPPQVL